MDAHAADGVVMDDVDKHGRTRTDTDKTWSDWRVEQAFFLSLNGPFAGLLEQREYTSHRDVADLVLEPVWVRDNVLGKTFETGRVHAMVYSSRRNPKLVEQRMQGVRYLG